MAIKSTYEELEQRVKEFGNEVFDRKQAQEALRESGERYRGFIQNSPVAMYAINTEGEFIYANKKLVEITGYDPNEWVNKPFDSLATLGLAQK